MAAGRVVIGLVEMQEAAERNIGPEYAEAAGIDVEALYATSNAMAQKLVTQMSHTERELVENGSPEWLAPLMLIATAWSHAFACGVAAARVEDGAS